MCKVCGTDKICQIAIKGYYVNTEKEIKSI